MYHRVILLFFLLTSLSLRATESFDPPAVYLTWQRNPESTMTIQWITRTDRKSDLIEYQPEGAKEWLKATGTHTQMPQGYPYLIHRVELINLQPATTYLFRPGPDAVTFKFCTMSSDSKKPIRFIVGGDVYHDSLDVLEKMNRQAAAANPSFALVGGDLAYTSTVFAFWFKVGVVKEKMDRWIHWLMAWKKQMVTSDGCLIPIIPAIGNHDTNGRFGQTPAYAPFFYALFPMPGAQGYNVLDFDKYLSIIILDSNHTHPVKGAQTHWLFHTLQQRKNIPHKFALYHVGAYPSVRSFDGDLSKQIRKYWVPIFDQFELSAAFEHHDHAYKRTYPLRNGKIDPAGVLYIGDGAWGIAKPRVPKERWYLAKTASAQYVLVVTLDGDSRYFKAIDSMGNIIDEYIQKAK